MGDKFSSVLSYAHRNSEIPFILNSLRKVMFINNINPLKPSSLFRKIKSKIILIILVVTIQLLIISHCNINVTEGYIESSNWTKVESGVNNRLYDIDFPDEQNGWVVGDSGIILNSKNGGESWNLQNCPTEDILFAVDFIDNKNGWICSRNSILKTSNGGETWKIKYSENLGEGHFRDLQFLDKNNGFVVGGKGSFGSIGVLLKTEDGGETWQDVTPQSSNTLTSISVVDKQNIWICGFGGTILYTIDMGLTWTKKNLDISPSPYLTTIQFVDQHNGWTSSRDDWLGFFRTTDSGNTWIQRSEESLSIFGVRTFFFIDRLNGWLGTFPGAGPYAIAQTTDGGQGWKFLPEDINARDISSFSFINKELGWAVGLQIANTNAEGVILCYRTIK